MHRRLLLALSILGLAGTLRATTVVACVGDSITFGSHVDDREHKSYPADLGQLLGPDYSVGNDGVSGATLLKAGDKPYWKQPAFKEAIDSAPQIVVIMLGTNDSKPQNFEHKAGFATDAKALIETFRALPTKPTIYLCQPCPVFHTNYGIDEGRLATLRAILAQVAKEEQVQVIDIHAALLDHPEMFADGVHPMANGAAVMAKTVLAALKR